MNIYVNPKELMVPRAKEQLELLEVLAAAIHQAE